MEVVKEPTLLVSCKHPILFKFRTEYNDSTSYVKLDLDVYDPSGTKSIVLYGYPDSGRNVTFNLSKLLTDYFKGKADIYQVYQDNTVQDITGENFVEVNASFTEYQGSTSIGSYTWGDHHNIPQVFSGGFSYQSWPDDKYFSDWYEPLSIKPFFTWKPIMSLISVNQPEFLAYWFDSDIGAALKVNITYTDGTTFSARFFDTTYTKGFYLIPCGITQLNLAALHSDKTISSFKVKIENTAGSALSEVRGYVVDYNYYPVEKFLLFKNSLSGRDTVRFIGKGEFNADYTRANNEKYDGVFSRQLGKKVATESEETGGFKLNTGFITRKEVDWLRDLNISRTIHIVNEDEFLPVLLSSKKLANPLESDLNSLTVDVDFAFTNTNYTPSNIVL